MFANIHYNYKKNKISLWEYQEGERVLIEEDYDAYCYVPNNNGEFQDLFGKRCEKQHFQTFFSQKEYVETHPSFEGDIRPEDRTLIDRYHNKNLLENMPKLHVHFTDIETKCDDGFPQSERIGDEILLISVYSNKTKKVHVFGQKEYIPKFESVEYHHCKNEVALLKAYFKFHRSDYPDILTGWNSHFFDFPYIIDRATLLIGENFAKKFSPVGQVREKPFSNQKEYEIGGITILDYQDLYKSFSGNQLESYKLDFVAQVELKESKLAYDGSLKYLWKTDWTKYVNYNIKDVDLVRKLDKKLDFITLVQVQAYISSVPINKTHSSIKKFENYLIGMLKDRKIVLPTAKRGHKVDIPGGFVLEPEGGLYSDIMSYDFTALYPHLFFSLNLSPETRVAKVFTKEGNSFTDFSLKCIEDDEQYTVNKKIVKGSKLKKVIKDKRYLISANGILFKPEGGVIPEVVHHMFDTRAKYKKLMLKYEQEDKPDLARKYDLYQNVVKVNCNAIYGIMANASFRFFNPDLASAITLTGQKLTKFTKERIDEFCRKKFKIDNDVTLYADTDSCYLHFESITKKLNIKPEKLVDSLNIIDKKVIKPFLDELFMEFSNEYLNNPINNLNLKRECIAKSILFTTKKRYVMAVLDKEGTSYDPPKIKAVGIEIVRSSTPGYCRDKIKEIATMILFGKTKSEVVTKVKEIHNDFLEQPPDVIAFPRGIKDLDGYDGMPIHLRAVLNYNKLLKKKGLETKYDLIQSGEKIKFIYLMRNNVIPSQNIIGFIEVLPKEFELDDFIDKELQFNKALLSPIQRFAEALKWGKIDVTVCDIEDFF